MYGNGSRESNYDYDGEHAAIAATIQNLPPQIFIPIPSNPLE